MSRKSDKKNPPKFSGSATKRVFSGLIWLSSGNAISLIVQIGVITILARLLQPKEFGLVSAALIVVRFTEIFSMLGIGPAIVQRPNLETRHVRTGFTVTLFFGVGLCGIVWILAPSISHFLKMDDLVPILRVLCFVFPIRSISVISESLLQRELQFERLAGLGVVSYVLGYAGTGLILAFLGYGVWALVVANLVQTIVTSLILLILRPHSKKPQFEVQTAKELVYFGGGFTLTRIFNYLALQGDNLVVGRWLGASALGIYGHSYTLMTMPLNLFGRILDKTLFPAMAKKQNMPERLSIAYKRSIALVAVIVMPMSSCIYVLAPELVGVLLGPAWTEVIVLLQIFSIGMIFRTGYKLSAVLTRASGAVYHNAVRQAVYALFVVMGSWVGMHWGLPGVVIGVIVALIVNFVLMAQLSLKLLPIGWQEFIIVYLRVIPLASIIGVEVWCLAAIFRAWNLSPFVILSSSIIIAGLTSLISLRFFSKHFLGEDGKWLLQTVSHYIPKKYIWLIDMNYKASP